MNEEQAKTQTPTGVGAGNKPETDNLIESANIAAERLEKANQTRAELLKREEALASRQILGGRSAGASQAPEPKEISDIDYALSALKGVIPKKFV